MSNPSGEKKLLMRLSFYRFIAGFAIILIPILGFAMLPILLILIISMICIIQILLDLKHHPHHRVF
jgi:antibiotic biosynthesis monooxygenase (ABM) superfamily enzyme